MGTQLEKVAKLINASDALGTDRAAFFVTQGGFDTHSSVHETLETNLGEINDALTRFIHELRSQGRWDDVVVVTLSEFGRTLTSNGLGTDRECCLRPLQPPARLQPDLALLRRVQAS